MTRGRVIGEPAIPIEMVTSTVRAPAGSGTARWRCADAAAPQTVATACGLGMTTTILTAIGSKVDARIDLRMRTANSRAHRRRLVAVRVVDRLEVVDVEQETVSGLPRVAPAPPAPMWLSM